MSRRFITKRNEKFSILKLLVVIGIVYVIFNFLINRINNKVEDSVLVKYFLNTYENKFNFDSLTRIDLSNPEIILDTALNFNDLIKLEEKEEEQTTFQENKLYQVYIYNTHQTEEYDAGSLANYNIDLTVFTASNILERKLANYNIDAYVENKNVKEYLNKYGFNYNQSYKISREFLETFSHDVNLYIDLHRDSAGRDVSTTVIGDKSYARIMFVVGTNYANYEMNLDLANKLNSYFVAFDPSISRGIYTRNSVYNQDFSSNVVLLELGGPYNTLEEIENTLEVFASVIDQYLGG